MGAPLEASLRSSLHRLVWVLRSWVERAVDQCFPAFCSVGEVLEDQSPAEMSHLALVYWSEEGEGVARH